MYAVGHYGAALLLYAPVGHVLLATDPLAAVVGAAVACSLSTLPDVDLTLPLVPHRGPTHSLAFLALIAGFAALTGYALGRGGWEPIGGPLVGAGYGAVFALVGVGSHLLADALTPMGVNVLWPLPRERFSLDVTRSDNRLANYVLLFLGVAACVLVLRLAGGV
jgi:inner membrane protein